MYTKRLKNWWRKLPRDAQDLLILVWAVGMTYLVCQLPVIDRMHIVEHRQNDYIEWQQGQWQPACPYCGKPLKEKE